MRGRGAGLADHDVYAPNQASAAIRRERALSGRDREPPGSGTQDHPVGMNPAGGVVRPPGQPDLDPAPAATCSGCVEHQQPRRLPRPNRVGRLRLWARDAAIDGGRSEPCHAGSRTSNNRIGCVASMAGRSSRGGRCCDQRDPGQREQTRPPGSAKSCPAARRPHCRIVAPRTRFC